MSYGSIQPPAKVDSQHVIAATGSASGANGHHSIPATNSSEESTGNDEQQRCCGQSVLWLRTKAFYHDNIGLFFVFLAQIFASVVSFYLFLPIHALIGMVTLKFTNRTVA